MITDDDTKKLISAFMPIFATKQDLENLTDRFVTNERFDQAMGKLDYIVGEIKTTREEQASHFLKHEEIDQDLAAIKAVPAIAHELKKTK